MNLSLKLFTFGCVLLATNIVAKEIGCGVKRDPIPEAPVKALIQIGIGVISGEEKEQAAIHAREYLYILIQFLNSLND